MHAAGTRRRRRAAARWLAAVLTAVWLGELVRLRRSVGRYALYFMHGRWERASRQAAGLLAAAAVRRGLRPVALHDAQQARGWPAMATDSAADWLHPNDRGHRVWADAFWERIAPTAALLGVPDGEAVAAVVADDDAPVGDSDVDRPAVTGVDRDRLGQTADASRRLPRPS